MKKISLYFLGFIFNLLITAGIWIILFFLSFPVFGLQFNISSSLPLGIYKKIAKTNLEKGDIVVFCLNKPEFAEISKQRGYVESNFLKPKCISNLVPLMKPIAAIAGDVIKQNSYGISVNQKLLLNSKALSKDSQGREMPQTALPPVVPKNSLLLISSYNPNSWDSRYWGLIKKDEVLFVVRPLLTFQFYGFLK